MGGSISVDTQPVERLIAVKEYFSTITSDGNPHEERKVSMVASSLGCQALIDVLGQFDVLQLVE